jgi:hypothetical protein
MKRLLDYTIAALVLTFMSTAALAQAVPVPDDKLTPGVVRHDLSDAQIRARKWGKDRRAVTEAMKAAVFRDYHVGGDRDPSCGKPRCEVDHRVPRSCGGADDVRNLYPQSAPYWHEKDLVEDWAAKRVKAGTMTVAACQAMFLAPADWRDSYRKIFGKEP